MTEGPRDTRRLLELLGRPLRTMILRHYLADSCIASTRVAIDVLERLGIKATPLRVEVTVFTRGYADRINAEGRFPRDDAERTAWMGEDGWSIGLGVATASNQTGIHLVALVEGRYLWDLSLDQASRPQYGIELEPMVVPVEAAFLRGRPIRLTNDRAVLFYQVSRAKGMPWTVSPNWRKDGHDAATRQEMVEVAVAGLGDYLR